MGRTLSGRLLEMFSAETRPKFLVSFLKGKNLINCILVLVLL